MAPAQTIEIKDLPPDLVPSHAGGTEMPGAGIASDANGIAAAAGTNGAVASAQMPVAPGSAPAAAPVSVWESGLRTEVARMLRENSADVMDELSRRFEAAVIREALDFTRGRKVEAAERLIAEIDGEKTYPYEYVCFRITGYRPSESATSKFLGEDLLHDLRLFVEDLSDSADMAADNIGEQVLTVEELAKQFNVSTKTISRWRELGLVSRRLVFDGRK